MMMRCSTDIMMLQKQKQRRRIFKSRNDTTTDLSWTRAVKTTIVFVSVLLMTSDAAFTSNPMCTSSRHVIGSVSIPSNPMLSLSTMGRRKNENDSINCCKTVLRSSTLGDDDFQKDDNMVQQQTERIEGNDEQQFPSDLTTNRRQLKDLTEGIPFIQLFRKEGRKKLPPLHVEDTNLLLYDVFLLVNLCMSISFFVTHRLSGAYLPSAFSEGCLLSILWIISGLYHGIFLVSAVDGHYGSTDERGGPIGAGALALNTFMNTINLRLLFALAAAAMQHRQVGSVPGEELLPLEIGIGLLLMCFWRAAHSYVTPRI